MYFWIKFLNVKTSVLEVNFYPYCIVYNADMYMISLLFWPKGNFSALKLNLWNLSHCLMFLTEYNFVLILSNASLSEGHVEIHSGYFYSTSSSPLLLRGAPDTTRILCRSFMSKRHSNSISPQLFHSQLKTLLFSKSYPDLSSSSYLPPCLNSKHHPL